VGILGRNGAGKSTLLNILAGVTAPTTGTVSINGRLFSILTLGAGFKDELSGRENVYLNSSILGIPREVVNRRYRDIAEFSELGRFLEFPLYAYSQGMRLRLAFSIAMHLDFDILLIDEVLSVGDVAFQKKCFEKIDGFRKDGKCILLATQSLDFVERLCDEAIVLERGKLVKHGPPALAVGTYIKLLERNLADVLQQEYCPSRLWADKRFWDRPEGSREARITGVRMHNASGKPATRFKSGQPFKVITEYAVDQKVRDPHFGVAVFREDGVYCYGPNNHYDGMKIADMAKGKGSFTLELPSLLLGAGRYRLSVAIWDKDELWPYDYHPGCYKFEIEGDNPDGKLLHLASRWEPAEEGGLFGFLPRAKIRSFTGTRPGPLSSDEASIELVETAEINGAAKDIFKTGEGMRIRVRTGCRHRGDYSLWTGIFWATGLLPTKATAPGSTAWPSSSWVLARFIAPPSPP
jgi:ABC-type polysaccharide/polyol phosphate transport system ATPase subunit